VISILVILAKVAAVKVAELDTDRPLMLLVAVQDVRAGKDRLLLPVSVTLVSCRLVTAGRLTAVEVANEIVLLVSVVSEGMVTAPVPVNENIELSTVVTLGSARVPATVKLAPFNVVNEFKVRLEPAATLSTSANAVGRPEAFIVPPVFSNSSK